MVLSVWRYSHLALAVSSFLFLTVAAATGIILAVEPVQQQLKEHKINGAEQTTLSQVIPSLKKNFSDIQAFETTENGAFVVSYTNKDGKAEKTIVDPLTGQVFGHPQPQSPLFQWATTLHRSLFLHETGRLIMGINAFLLVLITISGILLIIQRQKGLRRFFAPIEKAGFAQYFHAWFGRILLFPILAVALTGLIMSVYRFGFSEDKKPVLQVDEAKIKTAPQLSIAQFPVFQQTKLGDLRQLKFPFSDFPEDYFVLQLGDRELAVNQFTGDILASIDYSRASVINEWGKRWHTGRSSWIWAVVLAIASGYILFFIYTGWLIFRKRSAARLKSKCRPEEATYIILVGSENGSTFRFAGALYKALLKQGEKVYIADLNKYQAYPSAKHMVIMTSTYGLGDPPANASQFFHKLNKHAQAQAIKVSVVGFGSRSYPQFCGYAQDTVAAFERQLWAQVDTPLYTVDDQSLQDFDVWFDNWSGKVQPGLSIDLTAIHHQKPVLKKWEVISRTVAAEGETFLLHLRPLASLKFTSGDLLAFYPAKDHRERMYSIGRTGNDVLLSVKRYAGGLGSQYLYALEKGQQVEGRIVKNQHFHFPKKARSLLLIANGTGIAPFMGLIGENTDKLSCRLYCGFRERSSYTLYERLLEKYLAEGELEHIHLALSREKNKKYVSDLIAQDLSAVKQLLAEGGVIMICGSLAMLKDVLVVIGPICKELNVGGAEHFLHNGQILTDCY